MGDLGGLRRRPSDGVRRVAESRRVSVALPRRPDARENRTRSILLAILFARCATRNSNWIGSRRRTLSARIVECRWRNSTRMRKTMRGEPGPSGLSHAESARDDDNAPHRTGRPPPCSRSRRNRCKVEDSRRRPSVHQGGSLCKISARRSQAFVLAALRNSISDPALAPATPREAAR